MFIKYEKRKDKDGNPLTYVSVVDGYRDTDGSVKQRRVKSYGALEKQDDKESFIKMIEEEIIEFEKEANSTVTIKLTEEENKNNATHNISYNYGYKYLESIYDTLKIDDYFNDFQKKSNSKIKYNIAEIIKFLTLQRVLKPDSKRATYQSLKNFYGKDYDFSLDDIFNSLTKISSEFDNVQLHLRQGVDEIFKNKTDRIYYDVTNYYFEIDFNDPIENYRHKGVSKEHRLDPIIGFGLFLDGNGLPLKCSIFNGNTSESLTLRPEIEKLKQTYNLDRVVTVSDKALNTSKNIEEIVSNGDGYVFSQILRGKKGQRYHKELFNEEGYIITKDEKDNIIKKHKEFIEEYEVIINNVKTTKQRKVFIYYDIKDQIKARMKRLEKIKKAEKSLTNNAYGIDHSYTQYIKKEFMVKKTGEIFKDTELIKYLDLKKIEKDEVFDGYFCLITSELDYDYFKTRQTYHELSEIENTFRITKTDLRFRPVFHYKKENIRSHFLICYMALLIIRIMQYKLKNDSINLSVERIVNVLNKMNLENVKGIIRLEYVGGSLDFKQYLNKENKIVFNNQRDGTDQIEKDYNLIKLAFNTPFDYSHVRIEKFNKYFRNIKFHTTTS